MSERRLMTRAEVAANLAATRAEREAAEVAEAAEAEAPDEAPPASFYQLLAEDRLAHHLHAERMRREAEATVDAGGSGD